MSQPENQIYRPRVPVESRPFSVEENIRLTARISILGWTTPNVRGIAIDWDDAREWVKLFVYYEPPSWDEDEEIANCMDTEMLSMLSPHVKMEFSYECIDVRHQLPDHMAYVYRRNETHLEKVHYVMAQYAVQNGLVGCVVPNLLGVHMLEAPLNLQIRLITTNEGRDIPREEIRARVAENLPAHTVEVHFTSEVPPADAEGWWVFRDARLKEL